MIDDLSSIEVATIQDLKNEKSLLAYSKIQIDGDHLSAVFSEDYDMSKLHQQNVASAQKLRASTIDLISGIINNLKI